MYKFITFVVVALAIVILGLVNEVQAQTPIPLLSSPSNEQTPEPQPIGTFENCYLEVDGERVAFDFGQQTPNGAVYMILHQGIYARIQHNFGNPFQTESRNACTIAYFLLNIQAGAFRSTVADQDLGLQFAFGSWQKISDEQMFYKVVQATGGVLNQLAVPMPRYNARKIKVDCSPSF